ncbi:hypothetical protein ACFLIM_42500 [Nonomuraea sp. M3C6]|uniref:Uncharacterized protein n=1 Tax=Nonomuraea marmarensis TaxID=3351344 RepID=A0ABW7AR17_9ACTN
MGWTQAENDVADVMIWLRCNHGREVSYADIAARVQIANGHRLRRAVRVIAANRGDRLERFMPSTFGVEEQRGVVDGAGPVGAFFQPLVEVGAELGVDLQGADLAVFAVDAQFGLAAPGPRFVISEAGSGS